MAARVYYTAESLTRTTSTTTNYSTVKVTTAFTPNANKTYAIFWNVILDGTNNTYQMKARLQNTTGAVTLDEVITSPYNTTVATSKYPHGGVALYTAGASPTSQTIEIQIASTNAALTTGASEATLLILELIDSVDIWGSSTGSTGSTATSYTSKLTLSWTPATTGDYLIFMSCQGNSPAGDVGIQTNLNAGTLINVNTNHHDFDATNFTMYATSARMVAASGAKTAAIQFKSSTSGQNAIVRGAYGVALRMDQYEASAWAEDRTAHTSTSTTYADSASVTFTPANVVHAIIATGQITTNAAVDNYTTSVGQKVNIAGTDVGSNFSQIMAFTGFFQSWFDLSIITPANASTICKTRYARAVGASTATSDEHVITLLQLDAAGGVSESDGSAAGTSTVTATGASTVTATASASGTSLPTAVPVVSGSAGGTSTVTGVGQSVLTGTAAAAGTSTVAAIGSSTAAATGASAGTSTVTATGGSTASATASAAGTSTVAASGSSTFRATGTAAGTSTVAATGVAISIGTAAAAGTSAITGIPVVSASAAGTSTVTAVGTSTRTATAAASGTSTVIGFSGANAIGSAAGTSTVLGVGASTAAATAAASGTSTVTATGIRIIAAVATAAGTSTVAAAGTGIFSAVASAAGTSTVAATSGSGATAGVGNAAGTSTVAAIGRSTAVSTGSAAGTSTITGISIRIVIGTASAAGTSLATGVVATAITTGNTLTISVGIDPVYIDVWWQEDVTLNPESDIQAAVTANPADTRFILTPGIYRMQSIVPKSGNTFDGTGGAILNGSRLLTSFSVSGNTWFVTGQTQQGVVNTSAVCIAGHARCNYPEDLYLDDVPLLHVATLAEVIAGKWFFDYAADTIYIGNNPAGRKVEVSVTPKAFSGAATNVIIRNLTVEKYASQTQTGTIDTTSGSGWIIQNCIVRLNHGLGIDFSANCKITDSFLNDNGHAGFGGGGSGFIFKNNEVARNNYSGVFWEWEGGGGKITTATSGTVSDNCVHDNDGPGIWADENGNGLTIENNRIFNNTGPGVMYEVSYDGIIRNNTCFNNASGKDDWFWGGQILISSASRCTVNNNVIDVPPTYGSGITVVSQNRAPFTPAIGNVVRNNTVTIRNPDGRLGAVTDNTTDINAVATQNSFHHNTYHLIDISLNYWSWNDIDFLNFAGIQAQGQETGSTIDNVLPSALITSCI